MSVLWKEEGTRVLIGQPVPITARLFGLPFLVVGFYLLRILVGGILHPSEMTVAGWLLLPLMTLAFLVPGWLLVLMRKHVIVDWTTRMAVEETDFLLHTRRTETPLLSDTHVMLRYERGSTGDTSMENPPYWIHVYQVAGTRVLLGMFREGEKPEALSLAQRIATRLGVDVQDRCVEGGEVTSGGVVVERLRPDDAD